MLHFKNLSDFFAMGGYAHYVWSAYCIVFTVFLLQLYLIRRQGIKIRQRLTKNKLQQMATSQSIAEIWPAPTESEGL